MARVFFQTKPTPLCARSFALMSCITTSSHHFQGFLSLSKFTTSTNLIANINNVYITYIQISIYVVVHMYICLYIYTYIQHINILSFVHRNCYERKCDGRQAVTKANPFQFNRKKQYPCTCVRRYMCVIQKNHIISTIN